MPDAGHQLLCPAAGPPPGRRGGSRPLRSPLCRPPACFSGGVPLRGPAPLGLLHGDQPGRAPRPGGRAECRGRRAGGPTPHGRGLPVLRAGVLRPGAGGLLETPQPHPGGGRRVGHLRPGLRPGVEEPAWRLATGAAGHPGHALLDPCASVPPRRPPVQFLCCGKSSPSGLLGGAEAAPCLGAKGVSQDCLQGIRSLLRTHGQVVSILASVGLASMVYAMLLSSFLWFAICSGRSLDRRGTYALSPRARGRQTREPSLFRRSEEGPASALHQLDDLGPGGRLGSPRLLQDH
ncbi:tetraspanin-32 isoform X2 [Phyllostomus hastatus]|uniref:tetraspanin-32 isoform X2 n=1 Tax=Phyllostomus hastatus TaxID=9423 RepID=UPI001E683CA0|nr:tetraspanin-32 isoform X2 [Phyllostomus hastatus]